MVSAAVREAQKPDEAAPGLHRRPRGPVGARLELLLVAGLLLLAALVRLPTLDQPLVEAHAFRQTQTAYTALLFHEQGVDLLHPKLPVMGEPFEVPFELPLFQAAAAAVMSWGVSPDVAMRTTSLAFFLLSALLLWGLVRHVGGRVAAGAALLLYLFSPFAMLWSRTSLIEYMAVAGAIGWLWAGILWRERRRAVYAAAAIVAGLVAMLVKPTTGAFWVLPLLAYTAATEDGGWRAWARARRDLVLAGIVIVPFLAAAAWTRHADAIKGASEATAWLTSESLKGWNFGSLEQRLTWGNWSRIFTSIRNELTGFPAWLLPLAGLVGIRTRANRFWMAIGAVMLLSIGTFWNLYLVHDYYFAAVSPVVAALLGVGLARAWHALSGPRPRAVLAVVVVAWTVGLIRMVPGYSMLAYEALPDPGTFIEVDEPTRFTSPSDLIAYEGWDWSPVVPYYARRTGYMFSFGPVPSAADLAAKGYRIVVTAHLDMEVPADLVRTGRWTGVLGRVVYITADHPDGLRGAPVAATDEPPAPGTPLLADPVTVLCGASPVELPRGAGTTVLQLAPGTPATAKIAAAAGYGDVPVRQYILLAPEIGGSSITVGCRDATSVTIVGVYSQPG